MMAVFEKSERLRHIGHLDIMRAMQRALRRSGLPAAYSNGFNPHILLTFASALSVGVIGENEVMDVTLSSDVTAEEFLAAMNRALPPDMQLKSARPLEDRAPALMATVQAAEYIIRIPDSAESCAKLQAAIPALLERESIDAERKTKSGVKLVNIRPMIYQLEACEGGVGARLALTEAETCKVDMLMGALCVQCGCGMPRLMITRTHLLAKDISGALVPLENC